MRAVWLRCVLAIVVLSIPVQLASQAVQPPASLAATVVQRMALVPGERVLLLGDPSVSAALAAALRSSVVAGGGIDLGAFSVASTPYAGEQSEWARAAAGSDDAHIAELLEQVDLAVMLPGALVDHPPYRLMQEQLQKGRGRTIHFHWSGAYDMAGAPIPIDASVSALYTRAVLDTDYEALARVQRDFEMAARTGQVHVTTPAGTDLRFRIGNRPVTRQDGDASAERAAQARNLIDREVELPAGAIRVAPLEESVEGTIVFPPSLWNGTQVEGLQMRFQNGRAISIEATRGLDAVEAELASAGTSGRAFREFALGFNPLLSIPQQDSWIPYYGYGAGVVRLSLGDNTELGGAVSGGYVRWNFFNDATVTVGTETWVSAGRLVR
jgi:hypothetical protein